MEIALNFLLSSIMVDWSVRNRKACCFVDIMDTKTVEEVSVWLQEKGVFVEHCNSFEGMLRSLSSFANCHLVSLTSQTLSILYRLTGEGKVCTSALACVIPFLHILEERIKCV